MTDSALLVELVAKRDWLRGRSPGMLTRSTARRMKEIERELESRGVDAEAPTASSSARRLKGSRTSHLLGRDSGLPDFVLNGAFERAP
jgi:hypothetical protein